MKYSFTNKASFIALCAAALLPCYLNVLAGGGPNGKDSERPLRAAPPPASAAAAAAEDDGSAPPSYAQAVVASGASVAAVAVSSKAEKDEDDDEVVALRAQLEEQELATRDAEAKANKLALLRAKKDSILRQITELKARQEAAIEAANAAAQARAEAQAAEDVDPVPALEAVVNAQGPQIVQLEEEADAVEAQIAVTQGTAPAPKSAQERRWDEFSAKWTKEKAKARSETGDSKLSDDQRIQRETERVVNQVKDVSGNVGKKIEKGVRKFFGRRK